ncbi:MAG: zf-HC2 domain-containing protein [Oscillospiraceae bacterium]|nr:zf-HC2 domain-containing protein [Oscillospiraceae bacterium]
MTENTSCEMIRDLLPLYVEHLTSPETEKAIKAHLAECAACREAYEEMAAPEPVRSEPIPEVDGLKKVKKRRGLVIAAAALAVALIAGGLFIWFQAKKNAPTQSYDADTKTLVICGTGGYDQIKLPAEANEAKNLEVQDDNYHLSLFLPVFQAYGSELNSYLPAYLERTDRSLQFLRDYLRTHAPSQDIRQQVEKTVEFTIRKNSYEYSYDNAEGDRIVIEMGRFYWHREELYLLSLMNTKNVNWQQLGFAWYLGSCVDPYYEQLYTEETDWEEQPYYRNYLQGGGNPELKTPKDYKILVDAVSYTCLTKGMHWGTAYESNPVYETAFFRGRPAGKANEMSVCMATSFIAWLSEQYGFDKVSAFCFDAASFDEAFGTDFDSAYKSWSDWILAAYAVS